jgi:hypothetical protein
VLLGIQIKEEGIDQGQNSRNISKVLRGIAVREVEE